YVYNTFCWGYGVGYRFIQSRDGACNGNFLGIGADACNISVLIDQSAPYGLLITNGEFVAFDGPNPTQVVVSTTNKGVAQFNNCAFWGPCYQCARIEGEGYVSFNQCHFLEWAVRGEQVPCISGNSGLISVTASRFAANGRGIRLSPKVKGAVLTGNIFASRDAIAIDDGANVTVEANLTAQTTYKAPAGSHVTEVIGSQISMQGEWSRYGGDSCFSGTGYWARKGDGSATFRWDLAPDAPGNYTISVWIPDDPINDHATDARYKIHHAKGETEVTISQRENFRQWVPLGQFHLDQNSYVLLTNQASGNVVADAMILTKAVK
ncbi:MAG: hypothetical protein HY706_02025, partial [Candidatus Hydrogenedentes bacterium]|nr:hypothetical protein [Candidatus Hydrogenedentota bacterium]